MRNDILLKGTGASPGIVIGKALIVENGRPDFTHYRLSNEKEIREETAALHKAIEDSKAQLIKTKKEISKKKIKEAQYIIDTHILILQDKILCNDVIKRIRSQKVDAAWALKGTM